LKELPIYLQKNNHLACLPVRLSQQEHQANTVPAFSKTKG